MLHPHLRCRGTGRTGGVLRCRAARAAPDPPPPSPLPATTTIRVRTLSQASSDPETVAALWAEALLANGHADAPLLASGPGEAQQRVAQQLRQREQRRKEARTLHKQAADALRQSQQRDPQPQQSKQQHSKQQQSKQPQQQQQQWQGSTPRPRNPIDALLQRWRRGAARRRLERRERALRRARMTRVLVLEIAPGQLETVLGEAVTFSADITSSSRDETSSTPTSSSSPQVIGYISLRVAQPQALLPPPFPSSAPYCLYIDGLAVAPRWRRRGAARALLRAAEALGRRWGARGLWLDTGASNLGALALYRSEGWRTVAVIGPLWKRRNLMRKPLRGDSLAAGSGGSAAAGSKARASSGGSAAATSGSKAASGGGSQEAAVGGAAARERAVAEESGERRRVYVWQDVDRS